VEQQAFRKHIMYIQQNCSGIIILATSFCCMLLLSLCCFLIQM